MQAAAPVRNLPLLPAWASWAPISSSLSPSILPPTRRPPRPDVHAATPADKLWLIWRTWKSHLSPKPPTTIAGSSRMAMPTGSLTEVPRALVVMVLSLAPAKLKFTMSIFWWWIQLGLTIITLSNRLASQPDVSFSRVRSKFSSRLQMRISRSLPIHFVSHITILIYFSSNYKDSLL